MFLKRCHVLSIQVQKPTNKSRLSTVYSFGFLIPIRCFLQAWQIVQKKRCHCETSDLQISNVHLLQLDHLVYLGISGQLVFSADEFHFLTWKRSVKTSWMRTFVLVSSLETTRPGEVNIRYVHISTGGFYSPILMYFKF